VPKHAPEHRRTIELGSVPSTGLLIPRAGWTAALDVLRGLPGASHVPGVGAGRSDLPAAELVLRNLTAEPATLARYAAVCGFTLSGRLPVTYPHVLGFPLAMQLMTSGDFPFPAIGLVHVENVFAWTRPVAADQPLDLRVRASGLRTHPRGRQFDVVTMAFAGDDEVASSVSTYLHREAGSVPGEDRPDGPAPERRRTEAEWSAQWQLPGDLGRRYAAVSGDRNPIHLHPLTARLFGFPRAIAHGMWTAARALAALQAHWPEAGRAEVRFRQPILLPSTVHFGAHAEDDGWRFTVTGDSGRPHLDGSLCSA
jgi:hypothetical protein